MWCRADTIGCTAPLRRTTPRAPHIPAPRSGKATVTPVRIHLALVDSDDLTHGAVHAADRHVRHPVAVEVCVTSARLAPSDQNRLSGAVLKATLSVVKKALTCSAESSRSFTAG